VLKPGLLDWAGVVLVCLVAALAAILEALYVPFYIGTTIAPFAVLAALISNAVLPRMARSLVPTTVAAALPFVAWLVVMIGFGVMARPEGDVILPGAPGTVEAVVYGVLLGGALAGTVSVMTSAPPPPPRRPSGQAPRKPVSR
jgi:hypothetical protein